MIHNGIVKGSMVGVLFVSGSYLVVRPIAHSEWAFVHKRVPKSSMGDSVIIALYKEGYGLKVRVKDVLSSFTYTDKGEELEVKAHWVSCDDAENIIPFSGDYRWVTVEEMLLLEMKGEHLLIRKVLENLSFA